LCREFNLIATFKSSYSQPFGRKSPFQATKNVIEVYFSFNPIRLMNSAVFNRVVRKNENI